jgi:hypothetical protein
VYKIYLYARDIEELLIRAASQPQIYVLSACSPPSIVLDGSSDVIFTFPKAGCFAPIRLHNPHP